MLWVGSGWWSVVGLIFDILGFGVLAYDLWPEYSFQSVWRRVARMHRSVFLADSMRSHALKNRIAGPAVDMWNDATETIEQFVKDGTLDRIDCVANRHSQGWHGVSFPRVEVPEFDGTNHGDWMRAVDKLSEKARTELAGGDRPSVILAIALIFAGFFMQAWGSIPMDMASAPLPPLVSVPPELSDGPVPLWQSVPPELIQPVQTSTDPET